MLTLSIGWCQCPADDELAQELFMLIKKSKGEVITVPEMTEEELISAVQSLHRNRIRRVEYIDLEETEVDTVSESTKK